MAMIAHYNSEATQYDIMVVFVYAGIKDHEIFVEQPIGYEKNSDAVCLLLKALCDTKQSSLL